jgi:hypothetical protein
MKLLILIPLFFISINLFAQQNEKEQKISELIKLTWSNDFRQQDYINHLEQVKEMSPESGQDIYEKAKSIFDIDSLIHLIIPIYDEYYSTEDILGLIEFYNTPLGKKTIDVLPLISQESEKIVKLYIMEKMQKVINELEAL